ncbi:CypX Cytochrome P450, partial [Pyrenophora tritici-repentis]
DFHADVAGFSPYGLQEITQKIARKHLTKSINEILVPLSNETNFAIKHIFGESSEWKESIIMSDVLRLISRISSRVFLGEELCRNEAWLRVTKDWTVQSFEAASLMTVCPGAFKFLMPRFSKKCKNVLAIYNEARDILEPVLEYRRQLKAEAKRRGMSIPIYNDAIEWAEIESRGRPYSPVDCQLNLSFGAIHTSSALLTQVLTRLSNEPHLITPLRQEIIEVLKAEGMNKNSLYDLKLMDSALKETQRIKPDQMLNLRRMATDNLVTSDGLEIKKGQRVAVDLGNMVDLKAYPEPEKFDIYRYYNMRQNPATAVKSQLVATSVDNLTFGHGNHACPGRFFAANEIKLALCHLLLKYDWELSPDASLEAIYPAAAMSMLDPSNKIRFRRRKAELDIDSLV